MKPNILFIVADDLNAWIEPLGRHPQVRTPNINRLAAKGTVFTRAYCAAPYCNASRMAVFTGCLPQTTGIYSNEIFWGAPARRKTFIEHIRNEGFYCFGAGKVFHGVFDYKEATKNKSSQAIWREVENRPELWDEFYPPQSEPLPPGRPLNRMFDFAKLAEIPDWNYLFDWGIIPDEMEDETTDARAVARTVDFLRQPQRSPFFCAVGLYKPHLPWYIPKRFVDQYPLDSIALPLVKSDDLDDVPPIAKAWVERRSDHSTILKHHQWRNAVQGYLAAISFCDYQIGLVLDALAASPHCDNTIVVLWGDNGFHLGEKTHWRKFVLWEEATRVPLIVAGPGEKGVARVDEPVSLVDIFPTLCDMVDVPHLPNIDGVSLSPMINGRQTGRGQAVIMTWEEGNHSQRSAQWRYTRYRDGEEELYDHASDPHEWTNVANDPRFKEVIASFRR